MIIKMSRGVSYSCSEIKPQTKGMPISLSDDSRTIKESLGNFLTAEVLADKKTKVELPFVIVDKTHFTGYGSTMYCKQHEDAIIVVETGLSRYTSLCLRFNHLTKMRANLSSKQGFSAYSRIKMDERIDNVKRQIKSVAGQSALSAYTIWKLLVIRGSQVSFAGSSFGTALLSALMLRNGYGSATVPTINSSFDPLSIGFIDLNSISPQQKKIFSSELENRFLLSTTEMQITLDTTRDYDINIDSHVLERILGGLHLLSSCTDLLFNLILFKDEFTASESFMRGLAIMRNLEAIQPAVGDNTFSRFEFIVNLNDLYHFCFGEHLSMKVDINDVESFDVGLDATTTTISKQELICILAHPNTKRQGNNISLGNMTLRVNDTSLTQLLSLKPQEINNLATLIWLLTAICHNAVSKIDLQNSRVSVNLTLFLSAIDRNFKCVRY